MHHPPVLSPRHAALQGRPARKTIRGGFAWNISFITQTHHAAAVPEPSAASKRVVAILILVAQAIGTVGFTSYALWKFFEEERGDALLYLSIAIAW